MRTLALLVCLASPSVAWADPTVEVTPTECLRPAVRLHHLRRPREEIAVALTQCDGRANLGALTELSLLARAWRTTRPSSEQMSTYASEHPERSGWITARNRRLHPGLLTRLQAIVDRWPERVIVVVSGHRPRARRGSRHRFGKALDIEVEGVERAEVARFARTLADTGVGYYPRSSFTHIDVRSRATFWIDRSGPGQRADYGTWPGWELDPPGSERAVQLDRAEIRRGIADAMRNAREAPSNQPDPGDDPEVALDISEVRRRAHEVVEALRDTPPIPTPPDAIIRREMAVTAAIDWAPPWN